jgi:hypothetical protein
MSVSAGTVLRTVNTRAWNADVELLGAAALRGALRCLQDKNSQQATAGSQPPWTPDACPALQAVSSISLTEPAMQAGISSACELSGCGTANQGNAWMTCCVCSVTVHALLNKQPSEVRHSIAAVASDSNRKAILYQCCSALQAGSASVGSQTWTHLLQCSCR